MKDGALVEVKLYGGRAAAAPAGVPNPIKKQNTWLLPSLLNSIHVIRLLTVLITLYLPSHQTWLYVYLAVDTSIFGGSGSNYGHSGDGM